MTTRVPAQRCEDRDDRSRARGNAVVIALAVGTPPRRHLLGRVWGTVGAVVMRIGFNRRRELSTVDPGTASHRRPPVDCHEALWQSVDGNGSVRSGTTRREAIWIIIVADVVMSLDNVIARSPAPRPVISRWPPSGARHHAEGSLPPNDTRRVFAGRGATPVTDHVTGWALSDALCRTAAHLSARAPAPL